MNDWRFRPARDHGLTALNRLRSPAREPGLLGVAANFAWNTGVRGYLAVWHRLRVEGLRHLPAEPPFVLIAIPCKPPGRADAGLRDARHAAGRVFSLATGEVFFDNPAVSGFAAIAVNALPLWRERNSAADLTLLRQRLVQDRIVLILLPEGTRSRTGKIARFRPGIGALVAGSAVPVLPCHLVGTFAAWPAGRHLPRPSRIALKIGPALDFTTTRNDRDGWIAVADRCEAAVRGLDSAQ